MVRHIESGAKLLRRIRCPPAFDPDNTIVDRIRCQGDQTILLLGVDFH